MKTAKITVEKDFTLAKTDDRLFSSFIEHLGRAIYSGIYEPDHPLADEQGFRKDVISMVQDLRVAQIRYPGGNFLSGYNWKDGIGPRENRPRRMDVAWRTIEPNIIGIDEFADWSKKAGTAIMGAVNMGTGTPKEAGELLEYCNFRGGTYWSDLRKANGHASPHNIKTWCIGNEMDGPWQICHMEAPEYGKKVLETAKIMKWIDESIELIVGGSSSTSIPTYPEWDRVVLEHTYDHVDYISLHRYYENQGSEKDFLSSFVDMNRFIKAVAATTEYVKALKRSKKTIYLSFDEWNVWYQKKMLLCDWEVGPPILEDKYSLLDALVIGGLGITLLNNADRVKIACLAQLVNVIAPIFTQKGGPAIRQAIYWPFRDISLYGRGTVLNPVSFIPSQETRYGDGPVIANAFVHNDEEGMLTFFAMNTDLKEEVTVNLDLRSFGATVMSKRIELSSPDPAAPDLYAFNSFENPHAVTPRNKPVSEGESGRFTVVLAPVSWNVIRFKIG